MEHIEYKIMEVLNRNLNNYWNSVSDSTKEIIKDEIIEAISKPTVRFKDENRTLVIVENAKTMDEAITAADAFLEEFGMCVRDAHWYGSDQQAEHEEFFPVESPFYEE